MNEGKRKVKIHKYISGNVQLATLVDVKTGQRAPWASILLSTKEGLERLRREADANCWELLKTWTVQIEIVTVETWEVQAETEEEARANYMDGEKVDSDTQSRVVSVAPTENME